MGDETSNHLVDIGFVNDPFLACEDSYAPPIHFSYETTNVKARDASWEQAIDILKNDAHFLGYIEMESLTPRYSREYQPKFLPDQVCCHLPNIKTHFIEVGLDNHKKADLHVKRGINEKFDKLDFLLLEYGFYKVLTPRNRIYTLQLASVSDARTLFDYLNNFFSIYGGAKQLNFEVVGRLRRFPEDFPIVDMVPKGGVIIE
ncbi:hypothetical protein [Endothiovibrio diazotrophicus]